MLADAKNENIYIIGVYKKHANTGYKKKVWSVYYIRPDGSFGSFITDRVRAMYYKTRVYKVKKV